MEFHQDWIPYLALDHLNSLGDYEYTYTLDNRVRFVMPWTTSDEVVAYMGEHLTKKGKGSWGDIYARLRSGA